MKLLVAASIAGVLISLQACSSDDGEPPELQGRSGDSPGRGGSPVEDDSGVGRTGDASVETDSGDPTDAGPDAPIVYGNPLEGVMLQATRVGTTTFKAVEGTLWLAATKTLIFSDIDVAGINDTTVRTYNPATGAFGSFRAPPTGRVNGQALDPAGLVVQCEGTGRRIVRRLANGTYQTVASQINDNGLKKFTAPNDVIVHSNGTIFFTDPGYAPLGPVENGYYAVYRISSGGAVSIVEKNANRPNGIALSPDEKTLYVGDANAIKAFTLTQAADVSGAPKTFANVGTDGMTVDDAGNLYVGRTGGVRVFDTTGKVLGDISVAPKDFAYNVSFGDEDRKTLYIGARDWLMKIRLNVPGKP